MANSSRILAKIADILGQEKDAQYYRKLSWETSEAYRELLMEADCTVKKEFQTAYVLPLYYQMLSKEDKKEDGGQSGASGEKGRISHYNRISGNAVRSVCAGRQWI